MFDVALGSTPGRAKWSLRATSGLSGLQEFAASDVHNKMHASNVRSFPVSEVSVRTPADVMKETSLPSTIDYLSLDVEGSEMDILNSFPFDKYCIRYSSIETNNDKNKEKELEDFMAKRGYTFKEHLGMDHHFTNDCTT
jgi:hypothetical protein